MQSVVDIVVMEVRQAGRVVEDTLVTEVDRASDVVGEEDDLEEEGEVLAVAVVGRELVRLAVRPRRGR